MQAVADEQARVNVANVELIGELRARVTELEGLVRLAREAGELELDALEALPPARVAHDEAPQPTQFMRCDDDTHPAVRWEVGGLVACTKCGYQLSDRRELATRA